MTISTYLLKVNSIELKVFNMISKEKNIYKLKFSHKENLLSFPNTDENAQKIKERLLKIKVSSKEVRDEGISLSEKIVLSIQKAERKTLFRRAIQAASWAIEPEIIKIQVTKDFQLDAHITSFSQQIKNKFVTIFPFKAEDVIAKRVDPMNFERDLQDYFVLLAKHRLIKLVEDFLHKK